jgi:hypothetical protein
MQESILEDARSISPPLEGEVINGWFKAEANDGEHYDIRCVPNTEKGKNIPKIYKVLYGEIESATNVIKSLIRTKKAVKNRYFDKLLSLAKVGLEGETEQAELALIALEKLKEEMVMVEGQRIKNSYMKRLGIIAAAIIAFLLAVYFVLNHFSALMFLPQYLITFAGAMAGTWVSFGARRFKINFTQLSVIEEDMMSPALRLVYIGLCSAIFLLLLGCGIVSVSLGGASTENIADNIPMQAVIGVLCGLVESKIGLTIYKKAKTAISEEKA